jgi:ABC-type phosphate transport system substrate-binding protein
MLTPARRVVITVALVTLARSAAARAQIAIVVNHANPLQNLAFSDLRRLYLGETTTFPNRQRVVLVVHPPGHTAFYRKVLGMSGELVQRHWMGLMFRGEDADPPKPIASADELNRFVAEHPGAIAFLDLAAVAKNVKIITIDGLLPTDPKYRLR